MDEIGTDPTKPPRRHLLSPESFTKQAGTTGDADLTRSHGQSNGLRIHGIYFALVSLVALLLVIVAIAVANPMT